MLCIVCTFNNLYLRYSTQGFNVVQMYVCVSSLCLPLRNLIFIINMFFIILFLFLFSLPFLLVIILHKSVGLS